MIIGVNAGHTMSGQPGCGAIGYLNESDEARAVSKKLVDLLCRAGHIVYDCTNDVASSEISNLQNICFLANAQNLDLFISIHFNAGGGKGCECYTYGAKELPEAIRINQKLSELGFKDRGIKNGSNLFVVRNTRTKSILLEVCFVDNSADAELYQRTGADRIAEAICEAIIGEVPKTEPCNELETVNDIVWELASKGIITNKELWLDKLQKDENSYWLARKCANYMRRN